MNILFLDLETTFQVDDKKRKDPSPYIAENYLVSAGWVLNNGAVWYGCFKHNFKSPEVLAFQNLQDALDDADLVVAHNLKFELGWLRACGFKYDGPGYCTQIGEYVLARGQKISLKLRDLCERYNLTRKRTDLTEEYLSKGIGFEAMPWEVVEEYGIGDVQSLRDLYYHQQERLIEAEHLWPTINLMLEFMLVLIEIEENGIQIDVEELDRLEIEYNARLEDLDRDLTRIAEDVMGATPVNLNSPEQLSELLYSRRVLDKARWKDIFNLGTELRGAVSKPKRKTRYHNRDFVNLVKNNTEILYKTTSEHCEICHGQGKLFRTKKDGKPFSRQSTCSACFGRGFLLNNTKTIAGLRFIPSSYEDTAVGGFSTDKETLQKLAITATGVGKDFLEKVLEKNKIETYLSTFIEGIRRGLRQGNILHTSFMQTSVTTGRLSSQRPNYQNQPRAATFPVRKVVISRFKNGLITEADAKQLEFRIAGELSGNKQIFEDVINNIDVHSETAKHVGCSRQDAKAFTFAPLFGATPSGKPEAIARYYQYFIDRYGLNEWHEEWFREILDTGGYKLPSNREFVFPDTQRLKNGSVSNATQIKNYRVQSFATADIVPVFCIETAKGIRERGIRSRLVLTVHDSAIIDTAPEDKEIIIEILYNAWHNTVVVEPMRRWSYRIKIPLEIEIKQGIDWLQLKDVK